MTTYIIRRIFYIIPTLLGITLVTFVIMQLAPGDPAKLQMSGGVLDEKASKEIYESMRRAYGLDLPKVLNFDVLSVESNIEKLRAIFADAGRDGRRVEEITTHLKRANVTALEAFHREIDDSTNPEDLRTHLANIFIYIVSLNVGYDESLEAKERQIDAWWGVNAEKQTFDSLDRVLMIFSKSQYPMWLVNALTLHSARPHRRRKAGRALRQDLRIRSLHPLLPTELLDRAAPHVSLLRQARLATPDGDQELWIRRVELGGEALGPGASPDPPGHLYDIRILGLRFPFHPGITPRDHPAGLHSNGPGEGPFRAGGDR
jgi:hypothetical protein